MMSAAQSLRVVAVFIITQAFYSKLIFLFFFSRSTCHSPTFHVKDAIFFSFLVMFFFFPLFFCPLATVTVRRLYDISGPCGGSFLGHPSLQPPGGGAGERGRGGARERTANQKVRRRE